ncbi:glutathione gamma-glutamylcysteinyltransferase [Aestuariivirga litoralis]|uniref:glutathione gamma-glutamylcysteinyltransferase n=1 Tax=Aestuariivirga litoralis TaxID=2650924 RepID=A0A2W2AUR8_9HYPH|nr:phytochelatin synthase family protein [Aestuariivirga litoralis]PZF78995.1 glutathione gamma-glutamylcysteinyltransferase [Aestuariivirga litoralis]
MLARLFRLSLLLLLLAPAARADSLPLPDNLISSMSPAGESLLIGADAREAYFTLASNYLTQKTQSFCGVASMVMVFNAMQLPAPEVPEYAPFRTFTQDNIFNDRTEAILPQATILKQGITLDQIGQLLQVQPVEVVVRHASDTDLDTFRSEVAAFLAQPAHHVLVNYLRKTIGQQTGGHFSPLAAYDKESDRFLILDVARYKYPPVWVKADELFAAMNTKDSDNDDKSRGYVLIARKN